MVQAAAGKSMGCSKAAKAEAGVKAAAAAAKAEAGCVVAAARQEDLNSQSDYLTNHMPTIMASGGAGCSVAVSAEVIVEYIAIDDAAGTATVNVTLVPYI